MGSAEQTSTVYKEVICAKSKFFKAACSTRWAERQEKKVKLPEADPKVFQRYLSWIYSGQLEWVCSSNVTTETLHSASWDGVKEELIMMIDLYRLGDALGDKRLHNRAMEMLVISITWGPSVAMVCLVWENTPDNSPLRKMCVNRCVARGSRDFFTENVAKLPPGYVQEVAVLSLREHVQK